MRTLRAWYRRALGLVARQRRDREFASELESHLAHHVDDLIRAGRAPADAHREARRALGGLEPLRERYRDRGGVPIVDMLRQDLRYAVRQLGRAPGFAAAGVGVLTLGLGTSAAIFGFVDAALIRPLPYPNVAALVDVTESAGQMPRDNLSYADYLDWQRMNTVFAGFDVYTGNGLMQATADGPRPIRAARVSHGFFETLGVAPALGRAFGPGDDRPGGEQAIIITDAAWHARFGARPDIIGQTVTLSGEPHTIVGVLPASFQFAPAGGAEIWSAIGTLNGCELRRSCHNLYGLARLKPGVTVEAARAQIVSIAGQLEAQYPDSNRSQGGVVGPLSEIIVGDVRPTLVLLAAGVSLLLIIACVNVASLLLVRTDARQRELAVRRALGASWGRLAAQFFIEALVLVTLAGALAIAGAAVVMPALGALIPADMMARMPYLHGVAVNQRLVLFVGALGLATVFVLAMTPWLRLARGTEHDVMTGRGTSGRTWSRLGARLVVTELVIAVVLLTCAGLLGRSAYHLLHARLGFNPDGVATMRVMAAGARFQAPDASAAVGRAVIARLARLPGVTAAGLTTTAPVNCNCNTNWIRIVGHPYHGEHNEVNYREVSSDYFRTLQVPLLAGRSFTEVDDAAHPRVVIANQAFVRQYLPGQNPIGQRIGDTSLSPGSLTDVVGVVDDLRESGLDDDVWPALYYPFNQSSDSQFTVVVRTTLPAGSVLPSMATAIHEVDPDVGTMRPITMADVIAGSPAAYLHRSTAWLVAGFALVAWLLGVVGLYGVLSYLVSQRRREMGVRLALGAERHTIAGMVVREAARWIVTGVAIGIVLAVGAASLMRALLYGTEPWDVPTLLGVAVLLAGSAALASYLPARRAASVSPVEALRAE